MEAGDRPRGSLIQVISLDDGMLSTDTGMHEELRERLLFERAHDAAIGELRGVVAKSGWELR